MSYIDNIVKFHTFSKSTVRENLTLGEAVNPSGHTVTAKQIRTQDIPAFIYSFQTTQKDAETWAAGNIDAHVRHNDILYWGSQFNMGFEVPNCLIRVAKLVDENGKVIGELPSGTKPYWEPFTLNDKDVLKNSMGDPVITIHKGCKISYVHGDNNAAVNSNKFAAFVKTNDGRLLDHFISPTDQIIGGQPSLGYNLLLFKDGQDKALTEGEELKKDNYIANAYAGIIHFMDERTETYDASKNYEVNGFNVYCYEYTGNKLDSMLTESTAELKDYVDNEINKAIEYRTVNITKGSNNIEIEYEDTTDGDGNPGTYTISVDGYTTSEIDDIKDDINGALDEHIDNTVIHVTDNDKSRWNEAEELLDEHANNSTIHVTGNDKLRWNETEELLNECIDDVKSHIEDDERHTSDEERERWNSLFKNKVEALPSVYTGNNEVYINCYGFEYTDPSENIIFDKIEIKFAKNLDTITKLTVYGAPEISAGEVENNICKIAVAKVKTPKPNNPEPPADDEIEIATSDYNTNISNEVNLSQFKFSKNIILEKDWNYRFYFYDKNDNLFAASVIVNTRPIGDSLLPKNSVANRWLSERYDYWGAYTLGNNDIGVIANGLAVKLINSVQEHINDDDKHITEEDRERWDKGGSAIQNISAGDYIDITETNTISVINVTSNIAESADSYLTTAAGVREYVKDINDNNTISDIVWNLNDLLVSCINDTNGWVKELLRANAQDNREISEKLIGIVNYQDIYGTDNFEEATEMWINEASNADKKISTQLTFLYDSYVTNDLIRLLFYNLDTRLGYVYGASGSISTRYMKPGLTVKYLANVKDYTQYYPNEGYGKPRCKYITIRYRGKTASESSISENHIVWTHTPSIDFIITRPTDHPDTFRKAMAWDVIDSEEYNNNVYINGDNFINTEGSGNAWDLSLNVASDISSTNQDINEIKHTTVPTTAAVIDRITDDIRYHTQKEGHMNITNQRHSMAGGNLRTLISEKIEPADLNIFECPRLNSASTFNCSTLYLLNKNIFNGFIKEITFTDSTCNYNEDIYLMVTEYTSEPTSGRFIDIFKFESTREGGLKVVFGNDFKIDSEHDYRFTFHDTSEGIDEKTNDGNVSITLSLGTKIDSNGPLIESYYKTTGSRPSNFCAAKIEAIDYRIPTSNAVKNYVDDTKDENGNIIEEGILTKWHKENEYLHMEKSIGDSLKTLNVWENRQAGDICKGFIMNLPYLSKVKKISLVAANLTSTGPQSITWENYKLRIVDILSDKVLAESEPGIPGPGSTATYGYPFGQFNFNEDNQIYCDADREYKILFINSSSNAEITLKMAYANGNGSYMTTTGHVFGRLSPKVILENGTFKQAPTSFTVSETVPCVGYSCDFAVDMVKSAEFTHLSKQIGELRTYIAYMGSYLNQINQLNS